VSRFIALAILIAAAPAPLHAQVAAPAAPTRVDPPYVYPRGADLRNEGNPRTAVDYHLRSSGLMGSAGYMCTGDRHPLDAHEANMASASRFDRQRSFLGAKLSFAFH
jgi:hypothetical protein